MLGIRKAREWEDVRPLEFTWRSAKKFYPEVSPRRRWIVGLAAPLSAANCETSDRLYPNTLLFKHAPTTHRASLAKAWEVTNQVELLEVLVDLLEGGMRQYQFRRVGYPPLAWDHGRFVNLVRWGFVAGYLDEPTCWVLLEAVVAPVYRCYPGWSSYGLDYMVGRAFWLGESEPRYEKAFLRMWSRREWPRSLWQQVPWEAGADAPGQVWAPAATAPGWDRYQAATWTPAPVAVPAPSMSPSVPVPGHATSSGEGAALLALVQDEADAGRLAEATAVAVELVEHCRRRAEGDATAVGELAFALLTAAEVGTDPAVAVGLAARAVELYRQLVAADPGVRAAMLGALRTLAALLHELGRGADADKVVDEAVATACELAAADPAAHRGAVLRVVVGDGGADGSDGVARFGERAVARARRLAVVHPVGGPDALASLLYGMVPHLAAAGRLDVALGLFAEATGIRRHVPGPYEPSRSAVSPPPGRPDEPYPTSVTAVAVPCDAVERLRHRLPAEPAVAAELGSWLRRLEAELAQHGMRAEARAVRRELAALKRS